VTSQRRPINLSIPEPIAGFESINRYWDNSTGKYAAKILPGEFYVTKEDEVIVTVLGSCVSACIRDKVFGIGGMNHFMLPISKADSNHSVLGLATRFGNFAMEHLINEILKNGGARNNLEVKIFGGARVLTDMITLDIGNKNIDFVRNYIKTEALNLVAEDMGDIYPRKIIYHPLSGKVRMKKLRTMHNMTIANREKAYMNRLREEPVSGEIELF